MSATWKPPAKGGLRAAIAIAAGIVALVAAATGAGAAERLAGAGWRATLSVPERAAPVPAVVLMPGCTGLGPPAVRAGLSAHGAALLRRGHAVAVLDVLGPRGRASICADAAALARLERAAVRHAGELAARLGADPRIDGRRLAFLGQSFGGSVALALASPAARGGAAPFAAVVAYYPWCRARYGPADGRSDFDVPVLILAGAADSWTPVARCRRLSPRAGSRAAGVVAYPGAVHSFDLATLDRGMVAGVDGAHPVGGDGAAARASRQRYLAFLTAALRRPQ